LLLFHLGLAWQSEDGNGGYGDGDGDGGVVMAAAVANMQPFSTSLTATQHCMSVPKT
jgi:hypothetical protein